MSFHFSGGGGAVEQNRKKPKTTGGGGGGEDHREHNRKAKRPKKRQKTPHSVEAVRQTIEKNDLFRQALTRRNQAVAGHHNTKTWNGYKWGNLKSALQKYARRGMFKKGLHVLVEMDTLSSLFGTPREDKMRSKRTNMANRLRVILSEDIGVANPTLPARVCALLDNWENLRNTDEGRIHLLQAYELIAKSPKSRCISDFKYVYMLPPYSATNHLKITSDEMEKYKAVTPKPEFIDQKGATVERVLELATQHNLDALGELSVLIREREQKSLKQWGELWEGIQAAVVEPYKTSIRALQKLYKKGQPVKERPLFLYDALLYLIYSEKIKPVDEVAPVVTQEFVDEIYAEHMGGKDIVFEWEDFVLDRHTGSAAVDKSLMAFALKGAHLENEAMEFRNEPFRTVYLQFKQNADDTAAAAKLKKKKKKKRKKRKKTKNGGGGGGGVSIPVPPTDIPGFERETAVLAQTPVGRKPPVWLAVVDGVARVVKGPLSEKDKIHVPLFVDGLKTHFGLKSVDLKSVETEGGKYYLMSTDKGTRAVPGQTKFMYSKERKNGLDVLDRNESGCTIVRLVIEKEWFKDELIDETIKAFCFRAMLQVTDTHLNNLLYSKITNEVLSVDEESIRQNRMDGDNMMDLLFGRNKRPKKVVVTKLRDRMIKTKDELLQMFQEWNTTLETQAFQQLCISGIRIETYLSMMKRMLEQLIIESGKF